MQLQVISVVNSRHSGEFPFSPRTQLTWLGCADSRVLLTVMTYNVGNGLAPPERLVALLRESDADLVGLQELTAAQALALQAELANLYPYQVLTPTGFTGKGVLSRYPVVSEERLELYPDRPDVRVTVEVEGTRLNFLVAHPPPPGLSGLRLNFHPIAVSQLDTLATLALEHAPSVLVGDFNMTPRNPIYARFVAAGLEDAFATTGAGLGLTFPKRLGHSARIRHRLHGFPLRLVTRFDYIWTTPGLQAESAWVGADAGSDHLPVLARVVLPPV